MAAPRRAPLTLKTAQVALAMLLVFFAVWDLRAVLLDGRPGVGFTDTTVVDALELQQSVERDGVAGWRLRAAKGPLAAALVSGLNLAVGDLLVAARLLSVVCHWVVLWLVFGLARRLTGRPAVGLLAVVICGTFPLELGWFRLDFHEPLVAVAVVASLGAMMGRPRPARAVRLGLAAGLGLLTKLSFPLFVVLPGLWLTLWRARQRRAAAHLLLAGGVTVVVAGWWVVAYWGAIVTNLGDSTGMSEPWTDKLALARGLPGLPLMLAASAAGAAMAWWRLPDQRSRVVLLALCPLGAVVLLVGVFDWWSRYIVPALPVAGLLVAVGLFALADAAAARWPGLPARKAGVGLSLALLGLYVYINLLGVPPSWHPDTRRPPWPEGEVGQRELFLGMIAPDRGTYAGLSSAAALLRRNGWTALELPPFGPAAVAAAWRRQRLQTVTRDAARAALAAGRKVHMMLFHYEPDPLASAPGSAGARSPCAPGMTPGECRQVVQYHRWLSAHHLRVLRTFRDPDEAKYSVIEISRGGGH